MPEKLLAHELGTNAHVSPLLKKAERLGLCLPDDLEKLAILRGCLYYDGRNEVGQLRQEPRLEISEADFSNEELAVALLSICLPRSQWRLRLGAAMLSAEGNRLETLLRLARLERVEEIIRYVAEKGRQVEPESSFWKSLLERLPPCGLKTEPLPHITRFVAMTGFTRRGKETIMQWIRPRRKVA